MRHRSCFRSPGLLHLQCSIARFKKTSLVQQLRWGYEISILQPAELDDSDSYLSYREVEQRDSDFNEIFGFENNHRWLAVSKNVPEGAHEGENRTRTNTNPNDTEANAAGRSGNARALRKQNKCRVYHEGEGHWPKFSQKLQKARHLWVARTPQKQ